jgi:hypothetical protein
MDSSDDSELEEIAAVIVVAAIKASKQEKTPRHTGQPGHVYLEKLLKSSPTRVYQVLRMQKETFKDLCTWLASNTELRSTWRISIEEQVAMFLWTINYGASSRQDMERFQHSAETVSR